MARALSAIVLVAFVALGVGVSLPASAVDPAPTPSPSSTAEVEPMPVPTLVPSPPPEEEVDAVCEAASALIEDRYYQGALDLITSLREAAGEGGDPYLDRLRFACEVERIAALNGLGELPPDPSPAQSFGDQWDAFVEDWLTPLGPSLATMLSLVVGGVVLARVASLLPGVRDGITSGPARRWLFVTALALVLVGAAVSVVGLRGYGTPAHESPPWWLLAVGLRMLVGGSLILALCLAGRLKLALDAQKDGVDAPASKSKIIDLLYRFAAAPPSGADLPLNGDLAALAEGALPSALTGVWTNVQAVIKFVLVGTPWRIKVDSDEATYATVNIQHNGRALPKTVIDLAHPKLPAGVDPPTALRVYAAAVVITVLAKHHDGFEDLMGVRSWRSLGDYYLSTLVTDDAAKKELLRTAQALDPANRPAQLAALHVLARQSVKVGVLRDWIAWLKNELAEVATLPMPPGRHLDYEFRVRRLLLIAQANLRQVLLPAAPSDAKRAASEISRTDAHESVLALIELLREEHALDDGPLRDQYRMDAALLFVETRTEGAKLPDDVASWVADARSSQLPAVAYNYACHLAKLARDEHAAEPADETAPVPARRQMLAREVEISAGARPAGRPAPTTGPDRRLAKLFRELKPHLMLAFVRPGFKEWSLKDPDFARLRTLPAFIDLARTPARTDPWSLPQLSALKVKAVDAGYETVPELGSMQPTESIATYFGLPSPAFAKKVRIASIVGRASKVVAPAGELHDTMLEVLAGLFEAGVTEPFDLTDEWLASGTIAALPDHPAVSIIRTVNGSFGTSLNLADVVAWLRRIKDAG